MEKTPEMELKLEWGKENRDTAGNILRKLSIKIIKAA